MPDQAAAASWHAKSILFRGKRLLLLCPAIMEREDGTSPAATATPADRNLLHYQIRVLVNGVAASKVQSILASGVSCAMVTRGCCLSTEAYESNFFVSTFDLVSCPKHLRLFTHISTSDTVLFLHHFQHSQRVPCFPATRLIIRVPSAWGDKATLPLSITARLPVCQRALPRQWLNPSPRRVRTLTSCRWLGEFP